MKSRPWKRVVIVVPAFTQAQQCHDPLVAAAIIGLEISPAKCMTHRVDAPGCMVGEKHPYQSAPHQTCPATKQQWYQERQQRPDPYRAADKYDNPVFKQVRTVDSGVGID